MKNKDKELKKYGIEEGRKFEIFKSFMENSNDDNSELLRELANNFDTISEVNDVGKLYFLSTIVKYSNKMSFGSKEYLDNKFKTQEDYNNILEKTFNLSKELNVDSSLRNSNLFSYLLWNGYFSKDKKLVFQSADRGLISGVFPYDITNGIGVCLNFSSMLTDYLNLSGCSSATLINLIEGKKPDYEINIERQRGKENLRTKSLSFLLKPVSKKIFNHAFNLIDDNNKLYIYDATNFLIFDIENKFSANALDADIKAKLNPYFSYMFNSEEKSAKVIDKLNSINNGSASGVQNFVTLFNDDIAYFKDNDALFSDFYDDIKPNIDKISEVIGNSKQIKKDIHKKIFK